MVDRGGEETYLNEIWNVEDLIELERIAILFQMNNFLISNHKLRFTFND